MNSWDKCKNCGGDYALHHYETNQCPRNGVEAPLNRKQEWMTTTFELVDTRDAELEKLRTAIRDARQQLRATSENWREDCLYRADAILSAALGEEAQPAPAETKCKKCDGCGKIANTDDQEPWTVWIGLPLHSSTAVLAGLVRPITCPECG